VAEAVSGKKTNVGVGDKLAGDQCKHNLLCVWGGGTQIRKLIFGLNVINMEKWVRSLSGEKKAVKD